MTWRLDGWRVAWLSVSLLRAGESWGISLCSAITGEMMSLSMIEMMGEMLGSLSRIAISLPSGPVEPHP